MAGDSRTIRVTGLPLDCTENRLIDKLQIHFLRKKNGGGEISSVRVSKTPPGTAFITFEESEVASRLAQRGNQVLKVNDKAYAIAISLHHEEVDADKVLLCMSVMVDHTMLPGGKNTLLLLHESFPDVTLIFDDQKQLYTLKGRYGEVQALSSLLLESLEQQDQGSVDKPLPRTESKKTYNSPLDESTNSLLGARDEDVVVKHSVTSEDLDNETWKSGLALSGSYSEQVSHAALMEEEERDSATDFESSIEDFSLIVDSDIFRYLNKYCSKEYQSILRQHRVEVLDVNCEDITTLYLKPRTALSNYNVSSVKKAHKDLAHLYHQKESQLRKEYIYKHGIPEKELSRALESLRTRLPRLMIDVEDMKLYMVGGKSDVSEAKQFIGDMCGFGMKKEIHSDHLFGSSQSKFTFKQGGGTSSEPSDSLPSLFQDTQDLFMPKKDCQNAQQREIPTENSSKRGHDSVELKNVHDLSSTGEFSFQSKGIDKLPEDIFSFRRTGVSQERQEGMGIGNWLEGNKYTDYHFDTSRPSAPHSALDVNAKFVNKAELQSNSGTKINVSETQTKTSKTCKTKQTDPWKERKMAANFSGDMMKDLMSYKSEAPKSVELKERNFLASEQPHSLPLIKPTMYSDLDPNTLRGSASAKNSTGKTDIQEVKGDMSKFTMTLACLSGDQAVKNVPTMNSGSPRIRSNSFNGRTKKGEEMSADLSTEPNEISQKFQTREIVALDLVLPYRLWLYISSVYNNEIENLTSDLQVKERMDKEDIILCLRGINSEKVGECHHALKTLISTAELDFDTRTIPLSKFGVSDSKDKTLLELCTILKQRYKIVKILVLSTDMMILGPKQPSDEIEATLINFFHKGGNIADLKNEKFPNPESSHSSKGSERDLKSHDDQSRTSAKTHTDISLKDPSKTSDQNEAHSSKKALQVLTHQTKDEPEQDNGSGSQNKMKEEKWELSDKKNAASMKDDGWTTNKDNRDTSSGTIMISATKDKLDGENIKDHTDTTAQRNQNFTDQMKPGFSGDQTSDSQVADLKSDILPSHTRGNQNHLLCYVCEEEHVTVKQVKCGYYLCPKCKNETHTSCKICASSGLKGTMSVQESTITIPGFNRDTTLKIIYDIPDGVQGEDHPYPGAPFEGKRFEAFLPQNKATSKLLPLLEKAFHEGHTFTVKAGSSGDKGTVVWGSIPHKTNTEGGVYKNGYPDSTYIRRLEEALKAAGIRE